MFLSQSSTKPGCLWLSPLSYSFSHRFYRIFSLTTIYPAARLLDHASRDDLRYTTIIITPGPTLLAAWSSFLVEELPRAKKRGIFSRELAQHPRRTTGFFSTTCEIYIYIYIHDLIDRRTFISYIMARTSLESERPIMAGSVWNLPFCWARHLPHDSLRKIDKIISTNLLIIEPQLKAILNIQRSPLSRLYRHHEHSTQRRSHGRNQRIYRRRGTPRE